MIFFKKCLYNKKNKFLWHKQFKSIHYMATILEPLNVSCKNIAIIAPHADDELIGCFSMIKNANIFLCSLTGTNKSLDNKLTREKEFISICDDLKLRYYISKGNLLNDLTDYILLNRPNLIALPCAIDWHSEHRMINNMVAQICYENGFFPTIIWYQISVPLARNEINRMNVISKKEQQKKWILFKKYYKSQLSININRFIFVENHFIKHKCIEPFIELDFHKFYSMVKRIKDKDDKLNNIKDEINIIDKINNSSSVLYKEMKGD